MRLLKPLFTALAATAVTAATIAMTAGPVVACGCFSPPVPPPEAVDFAVNQQSEQIIFEVPGDGTVTAHVLIKYEGAPEQFAWLVPVPSVPELALSETLAFAIIDQETAPTLRPDTRNRCPDPAFVCKYHPQPWCGDTLNNGDVAQDSFSPEDSAVADSTGGPGPLPGGVQVLQSEQVGDYQTVVFSAEDAMGTVQWLGDNGFIVNDTMTPFMQPYLDAGMLFIAAKLIPGADVSAIRPLKMTYTHPRPIIPLKLTAVAAEPHLTVTSYIFADKGYRPMGHPVATVDSGRLTFDSKGRNNYPMVLARTIDEAGGDAFVNQFNGRPPHWLADVDAGCNFGGDTGFPQIEDDGICQCPRSDFDAADCAEDQPGLVASLTLLDGLTERYSRLTRITTRLSPEEMTFDAEFEAVENSSLSGRLIYNAPTFNLAGCTQDILDQAAYSAIVDEIPCATLYCGAGSCVKTSVGPGCRCDAGFVARTFTDLDGQPSVTCQPRQALVDLGADVSVPSSCRDGVTLGSGACVDVGGFPSSDCVADYAGTLAAGASAPQCAIIRGETGSPGAENFSAKLRDLDVCTPRPATCFGDGWLVANPNRTIVGVDCPVNRPRPEQLIEPPAPQCPGTGEDTTVGDTGVSSDTGETGSGMDAAAETVGPETNGGSVKVGGGGCEGANADIGWLLVLLSLGSLVLFVRREGETS